MKGEAAIVIIFLLLAAGAGALGYLVAPQKHGYADFYAPAITDGGQGALVKFRVSLAEGSGRTLVNIQNSRYREDTENALLKARKNAEDLIGIKLEYYDTILDVESIAPEVGGESAGAMFAVGIVAAYTGKSVNQDAIMSAGITNDGLLFAVEGIEEKILAAKSNGKTKFVVSKSQAIKNAQDITGIEIIRVSNVKEATEQMLA